MCSPGWGSRCPTSKSPRCRCKCGGMCHGRRPDLSTAQFKELMRRGEDFLREDERKAHGPQLEAVKARQPRRPSPKQGELFS